MDDASGPGDESAPAVPPSRRDAAHPRDAAHVEPGAEFKAQVRAARGELENQLTQARADFEEVNERIKERTGRDLIVATLIGVAIGGVLVASLVFLKWAFVFFALAAVMLGMFEFGRALATSGRRVDLVPQLIAGALMVLSAYFLEPWMLWVVVFVAIAVVVIWRLVGQMAAHDGRAYVDVLGDVLIAGMLQLYVPFLASLALVLLRQEGGEWWVLAFILIAVVCDVGAYAAGISFGRTPMAPRISPKKTWEGFAGAIIAAAGAGVLVGLFMIGVGWWMGLIFGLVVLITATVGDLGESMIKRDLGIKDMSSWLPGHGGVLDRLDSILPSTTAALALYYLFTPLVA